MAKLTAKSRKKISKGKFGVPSKAPGSGSYPMPDRSHAVNAMARASGKSVEAEVRAKAHKLYPGLKGSMDEGGTIPETGPYLMHEGEQVIPAAASARTSHETRAPEFHGGEAREHLEGRRNYFATRAKGRRAP